MAANRRIFYAIQSFGFAPFGTYNFIPARGAQSVGITTTFNLELVNQLGQLRVYENAELVPEIEFTSEKVLDGNPLLLHLATNGSVSASLVGRSNVRTTIALNVFGDTQASASGTSIAEVDLSGMYWSATTFTFGTDGTFKESFSAVGNNKQWLDIAGGTTMNFSGFFTGNDSPLSLASGSGGVQRKEDFIFYPINQGNSAQETAVTLDQNGQLSAFLTILPPDIPGISSSGTNDRDSQGNFGAHVSNVTVSANLGRDSIWELGRKGPFFRYVNFPVEVTSQISITATKWDDVSALENGIYTSGPNIGNNTTTRSLKVRVREGTFIDCGTQNKLQSVNYTGGDATGGNVTCTFGYQTYDDFTVTHPQDPSHLPWPY